ncbi:MAG: hypothetical protein V1909_03125 [Candidatus Micrarchaeota archaeon]
MKVPWDFLVKATHYFEIARATGRELTLIIPSYEYAISVEANADLLKIEKGKAWNAAIDSADKYASFLKRVGEVFFRDVKLEVVQTHSNEFREKITSFQKAHPEIEQTVLGAGNNFAVGKTPGETDAIRKLLAEESKAYLLFFGSLFGAEKPTVFMLHGRDFDGYPLEGLQGAHNLFGEKRIRENFAWVGVPSAPIITVRGNSFPLSKRALMARTLLPLRAE